LVLFDIPLLVESGRWRSQLDRVVVVDCLPETQVRRVVARSGLAEEEVWRIMRAQAPREQRLAAADAVVFNDGLSLEQLRTEVRALSQCFGL
jgi:dephospho-CoA kinase